MADTPDFESRHPADPAFWDERFEKNFTPWDAGRVPDRLREFVAAQATPLTALIPGCGAAHEARWLAELGWPVQAIDFSAAAVAAARSTLGPYADCVQQADFFAFAPSRTPAWVYERAFFCALPPDLWPAYAARMAGLLAPGGLLTGFFYIAPTRRGPPFGIEREALTALLSPAFSLEEDSPAADSLPVFAGSEYWMVWRRR